jgi:hypothetical protein
MKGEDENEMPRMWKPKYSLWKLWWN